MDSIVEMVRWSKRHWIGQTVGPVLRANSRSFRSFFGDPSVLSSGWCVCVALVRPVDPRTDGQSDEGERKGSVDVLWIRNWNRFWIASD